jgi:hypothetical protein
MIKSIALSTVLLSSNILIAQEQQAASPQPSDTSAWKHQAMIGASVTQVSFTDWTQGGENALAYGLFLNGKSTYSTQKLDWANSYKFGYGQAKLGSQSIRKTDDNINTGTVLTYKMGTFVNPFASATLITQFGKGFKYDDAGRATPVSDFFDPAYITQAIGVGYQPLPDIKTRLGAALRETLTRIYNEYSDNPATAAVEKTKVEGGIESATEIGWTVMENVVLNANVQIFAPLKDFNHMTIRSDNTLSAKVNKYLSVNLDVQLINDPSVQARTQVKQTLALGFSYSLL